MRKSINSLIIGAGKEQIYFIKEAKKLGINIIALDESPIAEGLNFVDIPIVIDIKDEKRVIEIENGTIIRDDKKGGYNK